MLVEKQFRHRERRSSYPSNNYPDWGNYFGEFINFGIPAIPEPIFLIRPEYDNLPANRSPFESVQSFDYMSDCSSVDYIIEDEKFNGEIQQNLPENIVEISIETNGK